MSDDNLSEKIASIKAQHSPQSTVSLLQVESSGARYFCPKCQPGGSKQHKTPDFVTYIDSAHCFRCGWHPDVIEIVMTIRSYSFKEAIAFLGGDTPSNNGRWSRRHPLAQIISHKLEDGRSSPQVTGNIKPGATLEKFDHGRIFRLSQDLLLNSPPAIKYLETRGFKFGSVKHMLGFLPQGQLLNSKRESPTGRLVFPQYSGARIINLYGRALEPSPKWLRHDIGPGPKGFWSPDPVQTIASTFIALTEGPFDALALHCSNPQLPVAAVFGTQSFQFDNFPCAHKIIFAFDNDAAGDEAFRNLALEGLLRGVEVFRIPLPVYRGCKDLAESFQKHGRLDITF